MVDPSGHMILHLIDHLEPVEKIVIFGFRLKLRYLNPSSRHFYMKGNRFDTTQETREGNL